MTLNPNNSHGTSLSNAQDASRPSTQHFESEPASSSASCRSDGVRWSSETVTRSWQDSHPEFKVFHEDGDLAQDKSFMTDPTKELNPVSPTVTSSIGAAAPYVSPHDADIEKSTGEPHSRTDRFDHDMKDVEQRPRSSSTFSGTLTIHEAPTNLSNATRVSTDAYGNTYPEGGKQAWLCVLGSFCGLMAALGLMNTLGTYNTWLSTNQLRDNTESAIGWIFGIYAFLSFFLGIQIGPLFDAIGPRYLVLAGSVFLTMTYFLIGLCTQYWHFLIVLGLLGGCGTSLVFTPAVAAIGHHFLKKRGSTTGLAAAGGSLGGVVFPLTLQSLLPRIGFAWSTRIIGFISLALLIVANLCITSRLPPRKATRENILPDFRIFRDPVFALTTVGVFFVEWGLFIPLTYIASYAVHHGVPTNLAYSLIAILNAGSCFGRWLPGLFADHLGRFNCMVATIFLCLLSSAALWLPANNSVALIIIYALVFGFASGSGISLTPVCVGQLCKVENYGRYYATCYTIVSFSCLTGIPIAGQLVTATGGEYWALIVFTSVSYAIATAFFVAARVAGAGWGLKVIY
ncbi:hypothetical protein PV10_03466 [Exophiala mesophila]|uniref:Major facilitator superfamily (MFS) profile domain-containing protein n=1 Tax=Exophiala mesophila TaxID=212818 RepID=A0A0D1ZMI8_EXOME|nr:uncharacterized protein PV10_03466 [Exophiala mesophila]KIV95862.1 hypothetical protein PV10_03466 [Exophiala mesophila]